MIGRVFLYGAILSLSAPLAAGQETDEPDLRCAKLTAETMAMMNSAPLMSDELATAVMWLRLDAAEAAGADDAALCVDRLTTARTLLEGWRNGTITPD